MNPRRIAIVGGGPGGLVTAYLLQKRCNPPCEITLFEASGRLGGKIVTNRFINSNARYEAGAAELYDYSQLGPDPLKELIAELGLRTSPMEGPTVILGNRFLNSDEDFQREFGQEAFQALKEFTRRAKAAISPPEYYESDWKTDNVDPMSRLSFDELLAEVPNEIVRKYIEVLVHSDLATEPHQTNAMYGLQNFLMNDPKYMQLYTIDGGIELFPEALAARLRAKILLNRSVTRIEKTDRQMYRVYSRSASNAERGQTRDSVEEFDFVVVALPNNWIPAIDWGGETLAKAMRRHHRHYDHPAHYLRVSILFEKPFWRESISGSFFMSDAFGGCCIYDESSRQPGCERGVLGWLLAGEAAMTLANFGDRELICKVLDSLPSVLQGGRELYLEGRVHRWLGSVNGLPMGYPAQEPDSRHQPEPLAHPQLLVVGDYLFDSTLNGILDSADTAVEWIVEELEELLPVRAFGATCSASNAMPKKLKPAEANGRLSANGLENDKIVAR